MSAKTERDFLFRILFKSGEWSVSHLFRVVERLAVFIVKAAVDCLFVFRWNDCRRIDRVQAQGIEKRVFECGVGKDDNTFDLPIEAAARGKGF